MPQPEDARLSVRSDDLISLRHRARHLSLATRRPVTSVIAGTHLSRFRGRGVDYLESRQYQFGDDIRNLDWRVTARTGIPHTKVFQEERERPVIVLLDFNPSMYFATQGCLKIVQAARAAAAIGWAAVNHGDRIGGLIYRQDRHHEARPAGGRRGMMHYLSLITEWAAHYAPQDFTTAGGGLGQALRRLRRVARPGSLVFLLSDFYAWDEVCERHLAYLRRHNDVVAVVVRDPIESHLPGRGRYWVSDGRQSAVLDLSTRRGRRRYRDFFEQRDHSLNTMFAKRGVVRLDVTTTDDPVEILGRLFRHRAAA